MADRLDIDFVRAQFPAFSEPDLADQAFFENAGGSYACAQVINRLENHYRRLKVQPYGHFEASRRAGRDMDEARSRLAAMLGVESDEIVFGPSTSQNVYVLAQAFRATLRGAGAIIVTSQDHEANTGPWRRLAEDGVEIREWGIDPKTGLLDIADLARLLDKDVALVCMPHCSNVVGALNPVAEAASMAREAGARICVDGVSHAPHGFCDLGALGADIYLFSAYKTYGPHQGVMAIRCDLARELPNQGHYFNDADPSKRLAPAGPDHAQVAACAGMADYVDSLCAHHGLEGDAAARAAALGGLIRTRETELLAPLMDFLASHQPRRCGSLRVLGPADPAARVPTVSLAIGAHAAEAAGRLSERGVMAGAGDFYAVRPLEALGIDPNDGVLRLSFVHYTSEADIDRLIAGLEDAL